MASPTGTARMPTQGSWRPLVEISVSLPKRSMVRRGVRIDEVGLTAKRTTMGWPDEMPPRMPPALLERNCGRPSLPMRISSALSSPVSSAARHAGADLDALHRVDAHHGAGEVLVELAVDRRAPAGGHALGHHLDHGADRGAGLAHLVEVGRPGVDDAGVGREEGVVVDLAPAPARAVDPVLADLHQRAADRDAGDHLARDRAGGHPHRRLARGGAPAAAVVADAVFLAGR